MYENKNEENIVYTSFKKIYLQHTLAQVDIFVFRPNCIKVKIE